MPHAPKLLVPALLLLCAAPSLAQDGGAAPPAAEKIRLAVQLPKGSASAYEQRSENSQTIHMQGMQMESGNDVSQTWTETCDAVDETGACSVKLKVLRVHGKVTVPMGGEVEFDTATGDPTAGMHPMIASQVRNRTKHADQEYRVKVAPTGVVTSGDGDAEVEHLARDLRAVAQFPKDPVAVGESWNHELTQSRDGMSFTYKIRYTLRAADADSVTVDHEGTFELRKDDSADEADDAEDPAAAAQRAMMDKMKVKDGKLTGTARLSRKDGATLKSEQTATCRIEMEPMPDNPQLAGGLQIDSKVKSSISRLEKMPEPKATPAKPADPVAPAPAGPEAR